MKLTPSVIRYHVKRRITANYNESNKCKSNRHYCDGAAWELQKLLKWIDNYVAKT
jgi:hypothetical protein